ncbi:MAG TPA: hypothetical protein PKO15_10270 [Fibrobacteria bacterium]|nr:hypothetical protein [Fibrobacteria bacterium]HOX51045.1 hypothetical protein [Fibrobacteria bacterium]
MAQRNNPNRPEGSSPLEDLARQVERYRDQAEMLGTLQAGRKLLECPSCGLHEDELADLSLVVVTDDEPGLDTGLRFAALDEHSRTWVCPACGTPFE